MGGFFCAVPPNPAPASCRLAGCSPAAAARLCGHIYPVHAKTRKSFGLMTRKLSVTESHSSGQFWMREPLSAATGISGST